MAHFVRDTVRQDLDLSAIFASYRSRYRLRRQAAEPVIGNLKSRDLRQFLLRGLGKVAAEWSLACSAHSLLKLAQARV